MILEKYLLNLMNDGGLLDAFTDDLAQLQPALQSQLMSIDEVSMAGRTVVIRTSGGQHFDSNVQKPIVSVFVFGLKDKSDAITCKMIANKINRYFDVKRSSDHIATVMPKTADPILMFTDLGRPVLALDFELLYKNQ